MVNVVFRKTITELPKLNPMSWQIITTIIWHYFMYNWCFIKYRRFWNMTFTVLITNCDLIIVIKLNILYKISTLHIVLRWILKFLCLSATKEIEFFLMSTAIGGGGGRKIGVLHISLSWILRVNTYKLNSDNP